MSQNHSNSIPAISQSSRSQQLGAEYSNAIVYITSIYIYIYEHHNQKVKLSSMGKSVTREKMRLFLCWPCVKDITREEKRSISIVTSP